MTASQTVTRGDIRGDRGRTRSSTRLRIVLALAFILAVLSIVSLIALLLDFVTMGRSRRFVSERITCYCARVSLWLCGIRVGVVDRPQSLPEQAVYISNHTSSLDVFAILALGLPRTRYFLSGFLRAIPIFAMMGRAMGIFWTCGQSDTQRRRRLFAEACEELKRTGESVFLTPEGQMIGRFNRGAFHLAVELRVPIVPLYIDIPSDVDPGPWTNVGSLDLRPGTVTVFFKPTIDTTPWTVETVDPLRLSVRHSYVEWTKQHRGHVPAEYQEPDLREQSGGSHAVGG